nr:DUF4011 domain-containing protein [Chloroherpeton thalassium]
MELQETDSAGIRIHSETAKKLNFACHQNAFALLRDLRIENNDPEKKFDNLLVTLSSNPGFVKPKSWRLDELSPEEVISVKDRDIELNGDFLFNLTDSLRGTLTVVVRQAGTTIAEKTESVELLAYNEWGGAGYMPELLAAFSMPNDPVVDRVLRDASLILRKAGKPDEIDGYKSGSRQRVWQMASAIYTAICNLELSYALPPASFERDGQKIRLPSQILENRIATCLDSSLLFASVFEQAGLNPVIALPQGHAVVGVWLQPEELTIIVIDEAETLRKRVQLNELLLIETTYVTSSSPPSFSKAIAAAADAVSPDKDDSFDSAIDIRRARSHRITPLGGKGDLAFGQTEEKPESRTEAILEEAPVLPDFDDGVEESGLPETPFGRLERWQRKLLDLSARNPLLNYRATKTGLDLICPEPGLLEDLLAGGSRISLHSAPRLAAKGQDEALHRQRTGKRSRKNMPARRFIRNKF